MTEDWKGGERRRHARLQLDGKVRGRIQSVFEAPVVDLSVSGALLEVPATLAPSARYVLKLPLEPGKLLTLQSEVVRSYVHGFDKSTGAQPAVRYRAALRFVNLTEEQIAELEAFLRGRGRGDLNASLST